MNRSAASGSTLVWAMVALVVIAGVSTAGLASLGATTQHVEVRFRKEAQALDVARAGLIDAFAWFRRQANQPPTEFAPQRDLAASPPLDDTDDPSIGLVREFEISAGYFGRYEVRAFEDLDGDGVHDAGEGVRDVTAERGLSGAGSVWVLESVGYVYRRADASVPWDESPNYRVARASVTSEIRAFTIVPPGAAAICADDGNLVTIADGSRVFAEHSTGVVFPQPPPVTTTVTVTTGKGRKRKTTTTTVTTGVTVTPTVSGSAEVYADASYAAVPEYESTLQHVFGATRGELLEMCTIRLGDGEPLPPALPEMAFVFVEGDLTVTESAPLTGVGLLIVEGDLTIERGSNSYFTGVVYVEGDYLQDAPSHIRGTIIARGEMTVLGTGDVSEVAYDPEAVTLLNANIGPFRLARGVRRMDSATVGGERAPERQP